MKLIGHMLFGGAMLMNNVMATEIESKSANIHMRYINIAPMFMDHKTEVCKDIAQLYKQGIITENAFMMKLNPQGTPPVDLVTEAAKNFTEMRTELRKYSDVPQGILVQASIGHGYWQDTPPEDFTCMETIAPEQNNSLKYIVCPYDDDFRTYFKDMARKLSQLKPDFLLIDDDYRIITGRFGCFCP
ncbi:MAG: hypothetical protein LBM70_05950 [Victivallales bacterium]|jgi:hypothetical protein|nr:hypothetical protein [Victivallales bacterium]